MPKNLQAYGEEWKAEIAADQSSTLFCDDFDGKKMEAVIDNGIRDGDRRKKSYDPYRIESLSADIAQSINSCMALERRYHDLRAQAESAFSEFVLFSAQYETLKSLETLPHTAKQRALEGRAHDAAAARFDKSKDPLAPGHKAFSQQMVEALGEAKAGEDERVRLSGEKWKQLFDHKLKMLARHIDPGGALNYGARAVRVRDALAGEIASMAPKIFALAAGISRVFGYQSAFLPTRATERVTLQSIFDWVRTVANEVELLTIPETLLTHRFIVPAMPKGQDKMREVEELTLNASFIALKKPRLRAVGLTMGRTDGIVEPPAGSNAKPNTASAVLTIPLQDDVWGTGRKFRRPRVQLPFVDLVNTLETPRNLVANHSIRNVSPAGQWRILLRRAASAESIGASQGTDADLICLHLVVSGVE